MSLIKSLIVDGNFNRQIQPGDTLAAAEQFPATLVANAVTVLAAMLLGGFIQSTETANATYTLDTAANIISALTAGPGLTGIQPGTTWRLRHVNNAAFTVTYAVTANTGMSVALPTVNASSVKDFLLTVINGTPPVTTAGTTVNTSAIVSGIPTAALANVTVGMIVTNAVAGLQGTTVIGVNAAAGTITFSGNANATNAVAVAISLSPVISVQGIGQGLL